LVDTLSTIVEVIDLPPFNYRQTVQESGVPGQGIAEEREVQMKKRVEFDAHQVVKKATSVAFRTKSGEKVHFIAEKPTRVPVRVSFEAKATSR
jgi:hypothetical protein